MGRTIRNKGKRDKKRLKEYRRSRRKRTLYNNQIKPEENNGREQYL